MDRSYNINIFFVVRSRCTYTIEMHCFYHFQITSVAQVILDLVHVALSEACGIQEMSPEDEDGDGTCSKQPGKVLPPPPSVARELFRTARDMIELFRAVIPAYHRYLNSNFDLIF